MKETKEMILISIELIREKIENLIYKEDLTEIERGELDFNIQLLREYEEKLKSFE